MELSFRNHFFLCNDGTSRCFSIRYPRNVKQRRDTSLISYFITVIGVSSENPIKPGNVIGKSAELSVPSREIECVQILVSRFIVHIVV